MTNLKTAFLSLAFTFFTIAGAGAHPGHVADSGVGHDHFLSVMLGLAAVILAMLVIAAGRKRHATRAARKQTVQ